MTSDDLLYPIATFFQMNYAMSKANAYRFTWEQDIYGGGVFWTYFIRQTHDFYKAMVHNVSAISWSNRFSVVMEIARLVS